MPKRMLVRSYVTNSPNHLKIANTKTKDETLFARECDLLEFITKLPPASQLLKKAANIKKGANTTGTQFVGKLTRSQIAEVA